MIKDTLLEVISNTYNPGEYPALGYQIEKWRVTKPLNGLSILDATPVFRNTLVKYIALFEAGAKLTVGISKVMPHDPKIVECLRSIGVEVITPESRESNFDIILDCAASFSKFKPSIGYVELTRSGINGYEHSSKPVFLADSGIIKKIETSLGTGESYFRVMKQLGYDNWNSRKLVIFGSGKVGTGIILYAHKLGAAISVITDPESIDKNIKQYINHIIDYRDYDSVNLAIADAFAIVTATGVAGAVQNSCDNKILINSSSILANMGVEDEFGENIPTERVLNSKSPINFILEEPTHLRYIDATLALHNEGAVYIATNKLPSGLNTPSAEIETELLNISRTRGVIGNELKMIM